MSATHSSNLNHAPDTLSKWLDNLCDELGWSERERAYHLLRVTLHAARDQMRVDEALFFGARLPFLVRRVYFDGWDPSLLPDGSLSKDGVRARIDADFALKPIDNPERAIAAVFDLVRRNRSDELESRMCRSL